MGGISSAGGDLTPAGIIKYFANSTAPVGYLKANGAAVSRTTYGSLFTAIGTLYGAGDGSTTFNLPDLRGEFPRGFDDGRGVDSGRAIGTTQAEDFKSHSHSQTTSGVNNYNAGYGLVGGGSTWYTGPNPFNSGSTGGTETRPRNIALLACIKY